MSNPNKIEVTVTVVNGVPTPSVDPIPVPAAQGAAKIVWTIDPQDRAEYSFKADQAIAVQNGGSQFSNGKRDRNNPDFKYEMDDANSDTNFYNYTITVHDKKGNRYDRHDPGIRNGTQ